MENLSSVMIINEYKLTVSELIDVCNSIFWTWVHSRISIGQCIGLEGFSYFTIQPIYNP